MSIYGDKFNITNQHHVDTKAKLDALLAKNSEIEVNNDGVETLLTAGNVNHASIDAKITACNTGSVVISSSALPSGAATESSLASLNGKVVACDTSACVISSSALPSGAASESSLASLNGKVVACDTSAVVVSSSALPSGAASESSLSAFSAKVVACNTGAVIISSSALPSGGSTESKQDSIIAALGSSSKASQTPVNNQSIAAASTYESAEINLGLAKHISYFGVSSDVASSHEVDLLVSNTSGGTYYKTSHSGMFLAGDFHANFSNVPYQYVKIRVKNNGSAAADFTLHLLST